MLSGRTLVRIQVGADAHVHVDLLICANLLFQHVLSFKFGYFICFNGFFEYQASQCIV
ncbi:hypothetical protein Hanom_Chr01g00072141 [Helianthus anomalus]